MKASKQDHSSRPCNHRHLSKPTSLFEWPRYIILSILIFFVRFYQIYISAGLPPRCRFTPTCSSYAIDALMQHGIVKGSFKTIWRLLRCQPFAKGGYDPP